MAQATIRWGLYLAALVVIGPIARRLTGALHALDGSGEATVLVTGSVAAGLGAAVGVFALAALVAVPAAWLLGARPAMTTAGLVLAWASWGTGTVDHILRREPSPGTFWRLAAEGVLVGLLGLVLVGLIVLSARAEHHQEPGPRLDRFLGPLRRATTPMAAALAVVFAAAGAWLIAVEPLKGQALGAAVVAGILAAAAGRLADVHAPAFVFLIPVVVLAIGAPVVAATTTEGGIELVLTVNQQGLFRLANILPLDWIAGAFLGVPVGHAWAGSLLHRHE